MKATVIIVWLLLIFSCSRKYSITNVFRKGIPADMQQWVLDSSYQLYIREVLLDTTNPGDKVVKLDKNTSAVKSKLIEIEYLLLSDKNNRVVYISTIPDKYLNYYQKKSKYLKREYLNAYDFSTFRFGKKALGADEIIFYKANTKHHDTWKYRMDNDSMLRIYEVIEQVNDDATNVYLVDSSLSYPAIFVKLDNYKIAFRNLDKEKKSEIRTGRPPLIRFCIGNTIYYKSNGDKYSIYFRFNKTLPPGYKDSAISFGNSRLVNTPF
jgi:hypothetical protein